MNLHKLNRQIFILTELAPRPIQSINRNVRVSVFVWLSPPLGPRTAWTADFWSRSILQKGHVTLLKGLDDIFFFNFGFGVLDGFYLVDIKVLFKPEYKYILYLLSKCLSRQNTIQYIWHMTIGTRHETFFRLNFLDFFVFGVTKGY